MKILFTNSFKKDLEKLRDKQAGISIEKAINNINAAKDKREILNIKIITGFKYYYRIKIGDFRLGIKIDDKENSVELIRVKHRKDIYKVFPPR
jgi:mRNA interferase RelE/StbE